MTEMPYTRLSMSKRRTLLTKILLRAIPALHRLRPDLLHRIALRKIAKADRSNPITPYGEEGRVNHDLVRRSTTGTLAFNAKSHSGLPFGCNAGLDADKCGTSSGTSAVAANIGAFTAASDKLLQSRPRQVRGLN